jgi:DNA polymerase-3 subunit gamma/tau
VFNTIYGHASITEQLAKEIRRAELPSALLFYGPHYTGRLTAALETARVLSCEQEGEDQCICRSCREFLTLSHPYTMALCQRDHNGELSAAEDLLMRDKSIAARNHLIRAVKKSISSYHRSFIEESSQSKKGEFKSAFEIDQLLGEIEETDFSTSLEQVITLAKKAVKQVQKLNRGITKSLPVRHIRTIGSFLRNSGTGGNRIVILEGVDMMNEAAANSLLKLLEEPPERVFFILLAQSRHAVLPTILSRVRPYFFSERERFVQQEVISNVFHDSGSSFSSLESFMQEKQGIDWKGLEQQAEDYLYTALSQRVVGHLHIQQIITSVANQGLRDLFLKKISELIHSEFNDGFVPQRKAKTILRIISDAMHRADVYNQGDALILETLYYRIVQLS